MSSFYSFAPLISRLPRGLDLMLVHFAMGPEHRIVVAGRTSIVLNMRRVVDVVVDRCWMLEDTSDRYSS